MGSMETELTEGNMEMEEGGGNETAQRCLCTGKGLFEIWLPLGRVFHYYELVGAQSACTALLLPVHRALVGVEWAVAMTPQCCV